MEEQPPQTESPAPIPRKSRGKIDRKPILNNPPPDGKTVTREFIIGFVGWWVVCGGIYALTGTGIAPLLCAVNVIIPIALAARKDTKQKQIAFGIIAALGTNFLISAILGMFSNGICFVPFFNGDASF